MVLSVHDPSNNVLHHFPAAIAELLDNAIDEVVKDLFSHIQIETKI
jgi:DNA gyrase/topoisomerase IV subunit B